MASPCEGLHHIARDNRAALRQLWGTDGCKKHVRNNIRGLHRAGKGKIGGTIAEIFDQVLLMEAFNNRVWRMTGQVVLFERKACGGWGVEDAVGFIEMVAQEKECDDAAVKRIMNAGTQAFRDNEQTTQWLRELMLPFRAAVVSQVVLILVQKTMVPGAAAEAAPTDLDAATPGVRPGVEFTHALGFCGGATRELIQFMDHFEAGRRIPDDPSLPDSVDAMTPQQVRTAAVQLYLNSHLIMDKEERGDEFVHVEGLRVAGTATGFIPALIGFAGLATAGVKSLGGKAGGATAFREHCRAPLLASLKRDDKVVYPVAAYLLAANAATPVEAVKWHHEFLNLLDDEDIRVPWTPYNHTKDVFLQLSLEQCRAASRDAIAVRTAAREQQHARAKWWSDAVAPRLQYVREHWVLVTTYAGLALVLLALVYMNIAQVARNSGGGAGTQAVAVEAEGIDGDTEL